MALRDQERRQLAEIEQGLAEGDPRFVITVNNLNSRLDKRSGMIKFVVVLLTTYIVGLTTIIGGVWLSSAILVALGGVATAWMPVVIGWRSWREHRGEPRSLVLKPA